MVKFRMENTPITFRDKYYEKGGDSDLVKRGLTIGGLQIQMVSRFSGVICIG